MVARINTNYIGLHCRWVAKISTTFVIGVKQHKDLKMSLLLLRRRREKQLYYVKCNGGSKKPLYCVAYIYSSFCFLCLVVVVVVAMLRVAELYFYVPNCYISGS